MGKMVLIPGGRRWAEPLSDPKEPFHSAGLPPGFPELPAFVGYRQSLSVVQSGHHASRNPSLFLQALGRKIGFWFSEKQGHSKSLGKQADRRPLFEKFTIYHWNSDGGN